jgi:predicted lipoprotein with Yx(FWY)xxD motif
MCDYKSAERSERLRAGPTNGCLSIRNQHAASSSAGQLSRFQVMFRGGRLYTFYGDSKPGDANGNGFKDVAWHAVNAAG